MNGRSAGRPERARLRAAGRIVRTVEKRMFEPFSQAVRIGYRTISPPAHAGRGGEVRPDVTLDELIALATERDPEAEVGMESLLTFSIEGILN